ncbi:MAG TPA: hypothetical protein VFT65_08380 [Candidatus Angelobacter sp.]|nr:hypothetical protein [Candidatus Angelobacter sp.]
MNISAGSVATAILVAVLMTGISTGQQPQTPAQPPATPGALPAEKKPVIQSASTRLAAARNVLIRRTHGNPIPFETISTTVEGWGRFTLVETPDKADLIIEVSSTGDSGVRVSSSSQVSAETGHEEKSSSTSRVLTPTVITMTVLDARSKLPVWSGSESVKSAMKAKAKENNLVEAAERLASKFHDRLEPPPAK